jgi:hypothetical protein
MSQAKSNDDPKLQKKGLETGESFKPLDLKATYYFGSETADVAWMTPFDDAMSATTTWAAPPFWS